MLHEFGRLIIMKTVSSMWDYHTPMEEIMEGLHQIVKEGKVRAICISNGFAWELEKANYYARNKSKIKA